MCAQAQAQDSPERRCPELYRGLRRQRHGGRSTLGVAHGGRGDAAFFGVEPGCELIVVERVRTADGVPVMLENNAFVLADHPYLQTLADKDLAGNSIFAFVAEHSGRAPLKSDPCTVEIALADAQAAPLLEVPVGEPLFYMEAYFTDVDGRPLLLGRQKIVGSRY